LDILASPFEFFGERACLLFRKTAQGRSTADLTVVTLRSLSPERGDGVCDRLSQRRPLDVDDLRIGEQPVQERLHVAQRFRSAQIEEKNPDTHFRCTCRYVCPHSMKARAFSTGVGGRMPCPRFRICPTGPACCRISVVLLTMRSFGPSKTHGSRLPWSAT